MSSISYIYPLIGWFATLAASSSASNKQIQSGWVGDEASWEDAGGEEGRCLLLLSAHRAWSGGSDGEGGPRHRRGGPRELLLLRSSKMDDNACFAAMMFCSACFLLLWMLIPDLTARRKITSWMTPCDVFSSLTETASTVTGCCWRTSSHGWYPSAHGSCCVRTDGTLRSLWGASLPVWGTHSRSVSLLSGYLMTGLMKRIHRHISLRSSDATKQSQQ